MKRPDWPACSKKPQVCPSQGCRAVVAPYPLQSQPRDSQGPSALAYPLKQNSNRSENPGVVAGECSISRIAEREGDQHVPDPQPHPHRLKKIQVPFGQIQIGFLAGVGVEDDVGPAFPGVGVKPVDEPLAAAARLLRQSESGSAGGLFFTLGLQLRKLHHHQALLPRVEGIFLIVGQHGQRNTFGTARLDDLLHEVSVGLG